MWRTGARLWRSNCRHPNLTQYFDRVSRAERRWGCLARPHGPSRPNARARQLATRGGAGSLDGGAAAAPTSGDELPPVLIAGGGIGGLTAALALRSAGIRCVVLEAAPQLAWDVGSGIGLWGPAQMVLRSLGLEHVLAEAGRPMACAGYRAAWQAAGSWLVCPTDLSTEPPSPSARLRSCLVVRRGELQRALYEALPEGVVRLGCRVAAVETTGSDQGPGCVAVTTEEGERFEGVALIAADGSHSTIRRSMWDMDGEPFDSGYQYWRAVTSWPAGVPPQPSFEAWADGARFGMVPMAGDDLFWFAVLDRRGRTDHLPPETRPSYLTKADKAALVREFEGFEGAAELIEATAADSIQLTPITDQPWLPTYVRGRTVLIGDAAHTMAPNLAQGACLAMEDAAEVAAQLTRALRNDGGSQSRAEQLADALAAYDTKRRRRARLVQVLVPAVHTVGGARGVVRRLRDAFFLAVPAAVKTPVFDLVHRAALGWSYTVPNRGQGLYPRLFGARDWARIAAASPALERFHSGMHSKRCDGVVRVSRGRGRLASLLCSAAGLPADMPAARVTLHVDADADGCERWQRTFRPMEGDARGGCNFDTLQWEEQEQMVERHGALQFVFAVVPGTRELPGELHSASAVKDGVAAGAFEHQLRGFRLHLWGRVGLPLPRALWPRVEGYTHPLRFEDGGDGWFLDVVARAPVWAAPLVGGDGLLLRYTGTIHSVKAVADS